MNLKVDTITLPKITSNQFLSKQLSLSDLSIKVFLANTIPVCSFPFLSSVMGCIKCDSSYHPFSHVRVDSLLKTFSLQYGFLW